MSATTDTVTIERAAAQLRELDAEHKRARGVVVEQLAAAIRDDMDRGVPIAVIARRAGANRKQVYRWLEAGAEATRSATRREHLAS